MGSMARSLVLCVALQLSVASALADSAPPLQSFYAQMMLGDGGIDIVSVDPVGGGVRVRIVRVSPADQFCPGQLVRAVERTFAGATVQRLAATNVCAVSPEQAAAAVAQSSTYRSTVDFIGSTDTVVAMCGAREKMFVLQQQPILDTRALARRAPDVAAVWTLGDRMRAMLSRHPQAGHFADPIEEADAADAEALGTAMLPELVSTKYERAFGSWVCRDRKTAAEIPCAPNYLSWRLDGYTGPPAQRGVLPADVLERSELKLAEYVAAPVPAIALSARVTGDVRVRLAAERATGVVTSVEALSGSPLLQPAAVAAVRRWRFAPGAAPSAPVEVTFRFSLRCPGSP
jgi:TonB family protein